MVAGRYTFIAVSIYVVVNIIIAIMEESYFQSRDLQRAVHLLLERSLKQLDEMDTTEPLHPSTSDAANREGEGEAEEQQHEGATSTTPAQQAEGQEDGGEGGLPPAHTHPPVSSGQQRGWTMTRRRGSALTRPLSVCLVVCVGRMIRQ